MSTEVIVLDVTKRETEREGGEERMCEERERERKRGERKETSLTTMPIW